LRYWWDWWCVCWIQGERCGSSSLQTSSRFRSAIILTKSTFLEDYISAPEGCCVPKFLHALWND